MDDEHLVWRSADGIWFVAEAATPPPADATAALRMTSPLDVVKEHVRRLNELEEAAKPALAERRIFGTHH